MGTFSWPPTVVQVAKRRQIGRGEGSVEHVEVFLMGGVGTSIMGDLDPRSHTPATKRRTPSTAKSPITTSPATP